MNDQVRAQTEALRAQYRPEHVKLLLIGESPPDPEEGELRFFYAPELRVDNLYRAVVETVYRLDSKAIKDTPKPELLRRLQRDGFWLIDAVEEPINHWPRSERRRAIREGTPRLIDRCTATAPVRGVAICHGSVYELVAADLRAAGVDLLHESPLPFPLGNWRGRFVEGLRASLAGTDPVKVAGR